MGDGHNLTIGKRHRSSSSVAEAVIGSRSQRLIGIRGDSHYSVPEIDSHFLKAEACCNELEENIKEVKKNRRRKKRASITNISEQAAASDDVPLNPVRKCSLRRRKPATYWPDSTITVKKKKSIEALNTKIVRQRRRRARAAGDTVCPTDPIIPSDSEDDVLPIRGTENVKIMPKKTERPPVARRKEIFTIKKAKDQETAPIIDSNVHIVHEATVRPQDNAMHRLHNTEEARASTDNLPRRLLRRRRYELPTVASRMKQAHRREPDDYNTPSAKIPFIGSMSVSPSHNVGANLQQVLHGIKTQQPVSGIPPTLAYHLGLGVEATSEKEPTQQVQSPHNRPLNTIKVGQECIRLPSKRSFSFRRLLKMYRQGEGVVNRYLRGHSLHSHFEFMRPFRIESDGSTSKAAARVSGLDVKQALAEYTSLYQEFEQVEKRARREVGDAGIRWRQKRDELSRDLATREKQIRQILEENRVMSEADTLPRDELPEIDERRPESAHKLNAARAQRFYSPVINNIPFVTKV